VRRARWAFAALAVWNSIEALAERAIAGAIAAGKHVATSSLELSGRAENRTTALLEK